MLSAEQPLPHTHHNRHLHHSHHALQHHQQQPLQQQQQQEQVVHLPLNDKLTPFGHQVGGHAPFFKMDAKVPSSAREKSLSLN